MDGRRIKERKRGKWTYVYVFLWGERLSQRSVRALQKSHYQRYQAETSLWSYLCSKHPNHVAEDNLSKTTLALLCNKLDFTHHRALSNKGVCIWNRMDRAKRESAVVWCKSDSMASANVKTLYNSSAQEIPCLTGTITLCNKDQDMHPLTFEEGRKMDSVCEDSSWSLLYTSATLVGN